MAHLAILRPDAACNAAKSLIRSSWAIGPRSWRGGWSRTREVRQFKCPQRGVDTMSWFVVFASTVLPIALLFMMLVMGWLQRGSETAPSLLRIRDREGAGKEDGTGRSLVVRGAVGRGRRFLVSAGMLALVLAAGQDLNAVASGPQITTPLKTDISGVGGEAWNVRTIELAPGSVDTRRSYPGAELVYVL